MAHDAGSGTDDGRVVVEDVGMDDWPRWRAVRLRALRSDPAAFSSTAAREEALDEDAWRERLVHGPRVVAVDDGRDLGLAGAHLADGPDRPQLFGVWVDPAARGRGIGAVLVEAVADRLVAVGHDRVHLWVMADNPAARHLYAAHGFAVDPDPPGPAPGACEVAMRRALATTADGLADDVLATVLADLVIRLRSVGVDWALGGSASRRVRGAAVVPRDVDLVVPADARPALTRAIDDLRSAGGPRPAAWRSSWLARWRHPTGAMVEFIGGAAVVVDGHAVALPPTASVAVTWRGLSVPVSAPAVWDRLAA